MVKFLKIGVLVTLLVMAAQAAPQNNGGNGNQGNGNGNQGNGNGNQGNGNGNQGNENGNQGNGQGNGSGNHGNGNQGNANQRARTCVEKVQGKVRHHLTDAEIAAICNRHDGWMHGTHSSVPTVEGDMDDVEDDFYRTLRLPKPETPLGHRPPSPRPRKEYRMLSEDERNRLHRAFNVLKNLRVGKSNYYDLLTDFHQTSVSPGAHWGPAFPGWHKQYLLRMERALQAIDPSVMIPYWDSRLDSYLGNQTADSIMWSDEFLGNKEGDVTSGPFAGWIMPRPHEGRFTLWRGNGSIGRMISDDDFHYITSINNFRNVTWHVDPMFEMVHGLPHLWVGGPMGSIEAAPNDPVFYMHHGFIDFIWEAQRKRVYAEIGSEGYVYTGLVDDEAYGVGEIQDPFAEVPVILDEAKNSFHYPTKKMMPYRSFRNRDALDEDYVHYYYYDPSPTCSKSNLSCGSPYLFCVKNLYKCAPKLREGEDCSDFATSDSCYNGQCVNGECKS